MSSKAVPGLFLSIVLVANTTASDDAKRFWPQWRGPTANGVSPSSNPPTEWSETKNVHWKIALPGAGSSTPVLWGNRLYVTTAVPFGARQTSAAQRQPRRNWGPPPNPDASRRHRFLVLAIDRSTGETVWETSVREELPHAGTHEFGNFATASAMTDGEHVWAFFGSRGLFCLDMEGQVLWEKDFGDMRTHMSFGEGASPVLYDEFIVVPWDHNGESFVAALRKITGEQVWKAERDEITSWSTPRVVEYDGVAQVITNATNRVRSYDLATGKLLWESSGMTQNVIPTPVEADGIVYVMSGFRGNALQAIRLEGARGDITGSDAILWEMDRDTPYTASPLLYDGTLYFMKRNSHILSGCRCGKRRTSLSATTRILERRLLVAGRRCWPCLCHRPAGNDGRVGRWFRVQGPCNQFVGRRVRCFDGGCRWRDLPSRQESLSHLGMSHPGQHDKEDGSRTNVF